MAVKWVEIEKDKEDINLVYQTIGDARVRDSHRVLDEICLPASHPYWDMAFPPNGWDCRCFIREEEKGRRAYSKTDGLEEIFNKSTPEHFRFNPGKEQTIFPKKHPYYGKRGYGHCSIGKLASNLKQNEECEILKNLQKGDNEEKQLKETQEKAKDTIRQTKKQIDPFNGIEVANKKDIVTDSMIMLPRSLKDIQEHAKEDINIQKWLINYNPKEKLEIEYVGWAKVRSELKKEKLRESILKQNVSPTIE